MSEVRRLETSEELAEAARHHPVVGLDIGPGFEPPAFAVATAAGWAVVFSRRSDHAVPGAATLGDAVGLDTLFADPVVQRWFRESGARHLSAPRQHQHVLARHLDLGERGGDWDWMWTRTPPPRVPGEDRVVDLSPADRDAAVDLLTRHSPRTHGQPFARPGQEWVGVRDAGGALVALGGSEPSQAGTPTLVGVAVDRSRRGGGLGSAVSAVLTRRAVETSGACALGMFADNDAARRVYRRLGYVTAVEWRSRWLDR